MASGPCQKANGWIETSAGHFERFLDPQDKFMINACRAPEAFNREHWTVNVTATVRFFNNFEQTLYGFKTAWQHLRHRHPFIASTLSGNTFTYKVANEHVIKEWLSESFWTETESVNDFILKVRPRRYSTFHLFPATSEVLLRLHHWHADATAALDLLDQLLRNFALDEPDPVFGNEWQNLSLSFAEAACFPPSDEATCEEFAEDLLSPFIRNLPSIGLPCNNASREPAGTRRVACAFTSKKANQLVRECRRRGFSATSAVHAAIAVTMHEMKASCPNATNYTSFGSFNYRPYMPKPFSNPQVTCPLGQYFLGLPFTRPSADFNSHAVAFQKFYHQPLCPAGSNVFDAYLTYVDKMVAAYAKPPPSDVVQTCQASLSSLGLLPEVVQQCYQGERKVVVKHVEIITDMMVPGIIVYQWSWQGRLFLSANYNAAWMSDALAASFLMRVSEILFSELGINAKAT